MKTPIAKGRRKPTSKKESKANAALQSGQTPIQSEASAKMAAQLKAHMEAVGEKSFHDYDLALVASIAAEVSSEHPEPKDAVKHALKILDAARQELSARAQKLKTIIDAKLPPYRFQYSFQEGIRAITQQKRSARAEEYFRKFLVSDVGSETASEELGRLKRDCFTMDEIISYRRSYENRSPRKQRT